MKSLIVNVAAVVAAFAVSVAAVVFVLALRPAPLHEGDAHGVFVTAVPEDATSGEIAATLDDAARAAEGSLLRPDVSAGGDDYLYLGLTPTGAPHGYARPGFDPSFAPLEAKSAVDVGGLWELYSPRGDAAETFRSEAGERGISVEADNPAGVLDYLAAAGTLAEAAALVVVLLAAVGLYLGFRRERNAQILTVQGWGRARSTARVIGPIAGVSLGAGLVLLAAGFVALGPLNGWGQWPEILAIAAGSLGAFLAVEIVAAGAAVAMYRWLPRRRAAGQATSGPYRASLVVAGGMVAVLAASAALLPGQIARASELSGWEDTWRSAGNLNRMHLSAAAMVLDEDEERPYGEATARALSEAPGGGALLRRVMSQDAGGATVLLADESAAAELGAGPAPEAPYLLVPRGVDAVAIEAEANDWLAMQEGVDGAGEAPPTVTGAVAYEPGQRLPTWTTSGIVDAAAFDDTILEDPAVLVVAPGAGLYPAEAMAALSSGDLIVDATAGEMAPWLASSGLGDVVTRVTPVAERPLVIIGEARAAVARQAVAMGFAVLVGAVVVAVFAATHLAQHGRRDAILATQGWPMLRLVRLPAGALAALGAAASLAVALPAGSWPGALCGLAASAAGVAILVAVLAAQRARSLARRVSSP